jgi:cyclooctatin synthase
MSVATAEPRIPTMPGAMPFIGHAFTFWRNPLKFFNAVSQQGPLVRIQLGPYHAYLVSDHELLNEILVRRGKDFEKGMQHDRVRRMLGNGILLSDGDFHRRQRLLMQPAFHHSNMFKYVDIMRSSAAAAYDSWADGQQVLMYDMFYELAVRIVIRAFFSTDLADSDIDEVYACMPIVIAGVERRAAIPPALLDRVPTRSSKQFHDAMDRLIKVGHRIVADLDEMPDRPSDDLMARLFAARDGGNTEMTNQQIHEEFMTMLTAGSETTPSAMSWTVYLLGRYPDVQRRVQAEIDGVVGDRAITAEDVPKLEYTRRVVTESLRIYPPVWGLGRRAKVDTEIGGHPIPARTEVLYSIYAIHHDANIYPEPEKFDPDRWLPERRSGIPRSAFQPFGAGSRNCIGEAFAWNEIQVVLATLMRDWSVQPVSAEPIQPVAKGALVPGPLPMTVVRRHK